MNKYRKISLLAKLSKESKNKPTNLYEQDKQEKLDEELKKKQELVDKEIQRQEKRQMRLKERMRLRNEFDERNKAIADRANKSSPYSSD